MVFVSPKVHKMDTWNLLWIVVCCDTIVKFLVISVKALVTLLPFKTIPLRKRGNFYSTIETIGLFYRYLIPIHPWILYLVYSEPSVKLLEKVTDLSVTEEMSVANSAIKSSTSTIFPLFLCILYLIFKLNQIYSGFNELVQSARELLLNMVTKKFKIF